MVDVPVITSSFCGGDFSDFSVLDIGCGDMMMAIGLLALKPARITGLDVHVREFNVIEHAVREVSNAGYSVPNDYNDHLSYVSYEGKVFPFPDNAFDLIFSWGTIEHICDPRITLLEARRVVKPTGRIFIVVHPWFHSFHGSHISDYISEPFFHLHRPDSWVWDQLNEFLTNHPELAEKPIRFWRPEGYTLRSYLREVMWPAYRTLNRYSARRFLTEALETGLIIEKLETALEEHPAASSVRGESYADLITAGSTILFRPGKNGESVGRRTLWHSKLFSRSRA
jgi:SAM-dependent methyltransferase